MRVAYHEAGHLLVANDLGFQIKSAGFVSGTGFVRREGLAPDAPDEERERELVVILAGGEAERYAPERPDRYDRDPWLTDGEMALLSPRGEQEESDGPTDVERLPSDEQRIAGYRERLGDDAVTRASEFAAELVMRMHAVGRLERAANEIWRLGSLTPADLEWLLGAPV